MATAHRILCLKRAEHEADLDFCVVLYWLGHLRSCATQASCRALAISRSKKPEVINGRSDFTYTSMCKTWYGLKEDYVAGMGNRICVTTHHDCAIYHM